MMNAAEHYLEAELLLTRADREWGWQATDEPLAYSRAQMYVEQAHVHAILATVPADRILRAKELDDERRAREAEDAADEDAPIEADDEYLTFTRQ